jgi:hypothetical protein
MLIKYFTNPSLDLLKETIQLNFGYDFLLANYYDLVMELTHENLLELSL